MVAISAQCTAFTDTVFWIGGASPKYFRERSSRAKPGRAKRILKRAGRGKPPVAGDELV
jgi:hypothetical protein